MSAFFTSLCWENVLCLLRLVFIRYHLICFINLHLVSAYLDKLKPQNLQNMLLQVTKQMWVWACDIMHTPLSDVAPPSPMHVECSSLINKFANKRRKICSSYEMWFRGIIKFNFNLKGIQSWTPTHLIIKFFEAKLWKQFASIKSGEIFCTAFPFSTFHHLERVRGLVDSFNAYIAVCKRKRSPKDAIWIIWWQTKQY